MVAICKNKAWRIEVWEEMNKLFIIDIPMNHIFHE